MSLHCANTTEPRGSRGYSRRHLRLLRTLIRRQNRTVQGPILRPMLDDIESLLTSAGIVHDGSEFAVAFREAVASRPRDRTLALRFHEIASASDPFAHKAFRASISSLGAQVRGKWKAAGHKDAAPVARLLTESADQVSEAEIQRVREAAAELAQYHDNVSRNRTKRRNDLDTVLIELAEIFAVHSRFPFSRYELGKAERSRLIKFFNVVLTPFLPSKHISPNALYLRWKRLQQERGKPFDHQEKLESFRGEPRKARRNRWKFKRKLTPRI